MIVNEKTKAVAQGVVDYIVMNPEKHEQANWVTINSDDFDLLDIMNGKNKITEQNFCNTQLCAAGTVLYLYRGFEGLNDYFTTDFDIETYAADMLGLDEYEGATLFYTMNESVAFDALKAIAAGDEDKFHEIVGM